MYFLGLATDYDGTIALHDTVPPRTVAALRRLKEAGRRLVMVTGRELPDLRRVCSDLDLFDRVVAENGAVIYDPATDAERSIATPPPPEFVAMLQELGVEPLSIGRSVVATLAPQAERVVDAIRALGLELQMTFNKGALMILPPGINKASGLRAALHELDLSPHNIVAVGDAENDHAFLRACGCAAAVGNALPALKNNADVVLQGEAGDGVIELVDLMLRPGEDLAARTREGIRLGRDREGREVCLRPYRGSVLVVGPPESGKSTLVTALTERMAEARFEFCVLDPEGDYFGLHHAAAVGDARTPPDMRDTMRLLRDVGVNLVVNTQALMLSERSRAFSTLLAQTAELRRRTGRPHWLVIDEAHQMLPPGSRAETFARHSDIPSAILVTAYPEALPPELVPDIDVVVAFRGYLDRLRPIGGFPDWPATTPEPDAGEVVYWARYEDRPPALVTIERPDQIHRRHKGKYAVGDVGAPRSFYFDDAGERPERARNLFEFMEIAAEVKDPVWLRHLYAGDYSAWFRHVIRDEELAAEAERIEQQPNLSAQESRTRINEAILHRYAAPSRVPP